MGIMLLMAVLNNFQVHLHPLLTILVSSPDPTHKMGKGLVTFERFLGCADSAVMWLLTNQIVVLALYNNIACDQHCNCATS